MVSLEVLSGGSNLGESLGSFFWGGGAVFCCFMLGVVIHVFLDQILFTTGTVMISETFEEALALVVDEDFVFVVVLMEREG